MKHSWMSLPLLACASVLLLAACGGGGPGIAGPAPNSDAAAPLSDGGVVDMDAYVPPPPMADSFGCYGTNGRWTYGNSGSSRMHPGGDCIDCHRSSFEGPLYPGAGTVMDYWDERTDCNGTGGITVELTGAGGEVVTATTNAAGNFAFTRSVSTPYTARIIGPSGATREMIAPQTDLDCMHCHTETGANGAPGRIVAP